MIKPAQSYEQAIEFLFERINFERTPAADKQDFKLSRMRRLLEFLDHPQNRLPTVHIAGTKGKGSTAIMLTEMLSSAGYRTGLYTSPHVEAFEERMQIAGQRPTPDQIVDLVRRVQAAVDRCESAASPFSPTFFEVTTALAWLFFEMQRAEIVILEVGLGGRLDSTNVCSPIACVLTTISRDHTQLLGSTLTQIAHEKAGIVKLQIPVISGVQDREAQAVIAATCREQHAELWQLGQNFSYSHTAHACPKTGTTDSDCLPTSFGTVDVATPVERWPSMPLTLAGEHQAHNAAVALATIDKLRQLGWSVSREAARSGLANVRWPMRIEVLAQRPTVIIDAGHNWESISALGRTLEESFSSPEPGKSSPRRVLIFAATKDKDVVGIARQLLPRFDTVILTQYLKNPRAVSPKTLLRMIQSVSDVACHAASTPTEAWQLARRITTSQDLICVTGSFFIAAEMRELILRGD
ncbi:MAG: bifunctional folylpolyglutamate synthase/dihydrofolate synthase [Planctomycetota bacterium]|nr:MAG: bifunctional folylpolyglutamate synthase/dihydrofolate synthase [Planctomycetota bacterium]GDY07628.1 bifunctional folylpolyglutamate synthase/dihydrofolate synthase [Planctomycetia bacterium]